MFSKKKKKKKKTTHTHTPFILMDHKHHLAAARKTICGKQNTSDNKKKNKN
jgi:hypothetical protein